MENYKNLTDEELFYKIKDMEDLLDEECLLKRSNYLGRVNQIKDMKKELRMRGVHIE